MKIYTKSGDTGETSLLGGKRVSKAHVKIDAYGTVDELNATLGMLADGVGVSNALQSELRSIQEKLFVIGSLLAKDSAQDIPGLPEIGKKDIEKLEQAIDAYTNDLPELKNFILPTGHPLVSHAHLARAVCRRAERAVVALREHEEVDPVIVQYLNRLSDYLFTVARVLAKEHKAPEIAWKGIQS